MPNNHIPALRAKKHLSQEELAERMGVTVGAVSRWERGVASPRKYNRIELAKTLECTEEDLGFWRASQIPPPNTPSPHIHDPIIPFAPGIPLIGREKDLERIKAQLCRKESNVVLSALNGIPGVGKTALATTLAYDPDIRAYFGDGILWAGLGPNPNIPGLLGRWAALLGLSESYFARLDKDQKRQTLRSALGERSMLVILDDVWKVDHALSLRVGGPDCAYLMTTRHRTIATQMAIDDVFLIEELNAEQSMQLLGKFAPHVVEHAPEQVRTLVQAVGGLPLALTLLGNYLRKQSIHLSMRRISAALERLSDVGERLTISEPDAFSETHPTLAGEKSISLSSIIAVSDQMLTQTARDALYAISVFPPKPESFSEDAAIAVAACSSQELDELVDAGLLESHGDRYKLHQTIADYARLHLSDQEADVAQNRFIAYITDYVEVHKKAYELLEQEITLILSALERAGADQAFRSQVIPLTCAAAPFLLMRGYYQETQRFLDHAYGEALASHDSVALSTVLLLLGDTSQKHGDLSQADEYYRQALEHVSRLNDGAAKGQLIYRISRVVWRMGNYQEAEAWMQAGLELAHTTEQRELRSMMCQALASLFADSADWERAEAYAREGLTIARSLGDRQEICALLINLGCSLPHSHPEKRMLFEEALHLAREIKSKESHCVALINLGDVHIVQEHFSQAQAYLHEAIELARRLGQPDWTSAALSELTIVLRNRGQYEEAETTIQEALSLVKERPRFTCIALSEAGNIALARGQAGSALETFQEMHRLCPQGDGELEALSFYGMARAYEQIGRMDLALSFGEQALTLFQQKKLFHYTAIIQKWYEKVVQQSTQGRCICGKPINKRPSGPGKTRRYCSDRCANRARKRKQREGNTSPVLTFHSVDEVAVTDFHSIDEVTVTDIRSIDGFVVTEFHVNGMTVTEMSRRVDRGGKKSHAKR